MKDFILHEANEEADEINRKAQEAYAAEKQHIVEDEKVRLKKDFERRESNVALEAKIANATEMNKNKLQVLAAASTEVNNVFQATCEELSKIPGDKNKYQKLLAALIAEGAEKIGTTQVRVRGRVADKPVIEKAISDCKGLTCQFDDRDLVNDDSVSDVETKCLGGVIVYTMDGKIRCSQTLNSRLQVAYDATFPIIKPILFNKSGSKHVEKSQ